jgi:hypothetical protein
MRTDTIPGRGHRAGTYFVLKLKIRLNNIYKSVPTSQETLRLRCKDQPAVAM